MKRSTLVRRCALALAVGSAALAPAPLGAQQQQKSAPARAYVDPAATIPRLASLVSQPMSELRDVVDRYASDRAVLQRRYDAPDSPVRRARLREFYQGWQKELRALDFDALSQEGKADHLLLENRLRYELELLDREDRLVAEMAPLTPFAAPIYQFHEAWRRQEPVDPQASAAALDKLAREVVSARQSVERGSVVSTKIVAYRTASALDDLRGTLGQWHRFYTGYDPLFSWWTADPYKRADEALAGYGKYLRERVVGIRPGEDEPIVGDPIGEGGMKADLQVEMIAYTPQQLVAIAEKEFAWLEGEMKKASREMGYGDDWKQALEKVKTLHVAPGQQTDVVRELAQEAIDFMEQGGYVTIPPLSKEIWRVSMMSPERQKVAPFFLGGEVIQVAFPTDGMAHEDKLMSMRGNNLHFSRATVHHELIPGHHLQGFMNQRYNAHRRPFATPFWTEGGALYWEFFLWDHGFPKTPEDRVGMLFWRMHRAARIIFSLNFHLGKMTPQESIDFLVDRVGHERANAEAEVRRSFNGSYSPLYQVAYMIGGLQLRALHQELVASGKMTDRQFHDAVYQGGTMPIAMVRARLTGQKLERGKMPQWKFAGEVKVDAAKAAR